MYIALKLVSGGETVQADEGRLQQLERRHFESRRKRAKEDNRRGVDGRERIEDK